MKLTAPHRWKGNVWSFTPAAYINIDDFEDYNSTADINANWLTSYDTDCGFTAGNGGLNLVKSATGKYMIFTYINDGSRAWLFSETKRSTAVPALI